MKWGFNDSGENEILSILKSKLKAKTLELFMNVREGIRTFSPIAQASTL